MIVVVTSGAGPGRLGRLNGTGATGHPTAHHVRQENTSVATAVAVASPSTGTRGATVVGGGGPQGCSYGSTTMVSSSGGGSELSVDPPDRQVGGPSYRVPIVADIS
jgi:hypothetical protein